jgi:beta-barrel assembly-enhancing protease
MGRSHGGRFLVAVAVLAGLLRPAAFASDKKKAPEERDPGKGVNFYSVEKEIALGRQMAGEVERDARMERDDVVSEYVSRLGQNLVRNSDAKVPFTIKVLDSEEVNAFALPGGFMFVNSGLLLKAENEAELAGVLSHEIAHVAARHGTKQASRTEIINYASLALVLFGGAAGFAIRQAVTLAIPAGFLQFSRSMETQADYLGLGYMYKSGYDPTAFIDFFEKIQTQEKSKPGTISRMFATHPMTGDRIKHAQKQIQRDLKAQPQYVLDTSEFHLVRERLQILEARRNGTVQRDLPVLRRRQQTRTEDQDAAPPIQRRN